MAFLIADSGSTKTEWVLADASGILKRFVSPGFNSDIMPADAIEATVDAGLEGQLADAPDAIFMYAASMGNPKNRTLLSEILKRIYPSSEVEVEHDLLASGRALCQRTPGIACILGTGSNSCFYDGHDITLEIGGQGYLFGDEGSGADLGKALLQQMLNGYLPQELVEEICAWKGLGRYDIRKEAYRSERPNVYLSQFSKFISANLHRPELRQLVHDRMAVFLKETVLHYPNFREVKTGFVGSVAFTYADILREACAVNGVSAGEIIRSPIEALVQYHL